MNDLTESNSATRMYSDRIHRIQDDMKSRSMDYLVVPVSVNLRYLTGLALTKTERLTALLLPQSGDPALICPSFEAARLESEMRLEGADFITWNESVDPYSAIGKWLSRQHSRSRIGVGLEPQAWYVEFSRLSGAVPNATYQDAAPLFASLRVIKSPLELDYMRSAIRIIDDVREHLFKDFIREGILQSEARARLCYEAMRRGGLNPVWWGVYFGENTSSAHGGSKDIAIKDGTVIMVDSGVEYEGYRSDITRTTTFRMPPPGFVDLFDIVREAQSAAIGTIEPGVPAESIDRAARTVIEEAGYGEFFTHRLGHGIGMEEHEPPWIGPDEKTPLREGMTFTVEPGIYLPGRFGIRLEENVVVTSNGCALLSRPVDGFASL